MRTVRTPHRVGQAVDILCFIARSKMIELDGVLEANIGQQAADLLLRDERVLARH